MKRFLFILLLVLLLVLTGCYYKWFYSVNVNVIGQGSVSILGEKNESSKYAKHSEIVVTAQATQGWQFVGWTGDVISDVNPITINVEKDINLNANFEIETYSIDSSINGSGVIEISPEKNIYEYGEEISITATPLENWEFEKWTGDINSFDSNVVFNIEEDMNIVANFTEKKFQITTEYEGLGQINIIPEKEYYSYGDLVSIEAIPDEGWIFEEWNGSYNSYENPLIIQIEQDIYLNALFVESNFPVNITVIGSGSVEKYPDKEYYSENEEVQLRAIPDIGWSFDSWSGDFISQNREINITIDGTKNITAEFTQNKYYLNKEITGNGNIIISPEKEYYFYGDLIEISAEPDGKWIFSNWEGDISGTEYSKEISIESDLTIGAIFKEIYYCEISIEGEGAVNLEPLKDFYFMGDKIELIAQPNEGNEFYKWIVNENDYFSENIILEIEGDFQISCYFKPDDTMTLDVDISGEGTIENENQQDYYYLYDKTKLMAYPAQEWIFNTWSGDTYGRFPERNLQFFYEDFNISAIFSPLEEYHSNLDQFDYQWGISKFIDVESAYNLFYENTKAGIYFIEIRPEDEILTAHIVNAVWIPFTGDDAFDLSQVQELFPDPEQCRFIIYGKRGEGAKENQKLNDWGYKSMVMIDGICGWDDGDNGRGYPIESGIIHNK